MPESKPGKPLDTEAAKKDEQKEQQRKEAEEKEHLDEELDEALEMTFPASDPIAVSRPDPPLKKEEEPPRDKPLPLMHAKPATRAGSCKTGRSKMSKISGS